jgi:colanic acid/amylovoran biosynthesis protein
MITKNNTFKFIIVNGWSDMNRGDSSIVLGMIGLIREQFPDCSICLMSEFGEDDSNFDSSYWAIKSYYPDVQILPALFPYTVNKRKIHKLINSALTFAISCLVLAFPAIGHYFYRGAKADTWKRLIESDVLLSKGGHIFYFPRCSPQEFYGFFKHAFPLLLGVRLGKKTALYAQSVGPFRGRVCQLTTKWFFNHLDAISVREGISLQTLQSIGVVRSVYLVPDAAFLLSGHDGKKSTSNESPVIITPRQWGFNDKKMFENYMKALAYIAEWLAGKGYRILLASHTIGPTLSEDDRIAVKYLYKIIESKENIQIVDTEGLTAYDLINLYSSARLLIGTRFHSVIFALLSSTPVIAISCFGPKTFGIMKSLGLEQFVFDISDLEVTNLKSTIQHILEREDQIREEISSKIKKLQEEAKNSGLVLLNSVLKER